MQNISGSIGYDIWTIRTDISKRNNTVIQNKLIKKTLLSFTYLLSQVLKRKIRNIQVKFKSLVK